MFLKMGVGRKLVRALDNLMVTETNLPLVVAAEHEGSKANLELSDLDRLGCSVLELKVKGTKDDRMEGDLESRASELSQKVNYLLEDIRLVEVNKDKGFALLRSYSPREDKDHIFYYEMTLRDDPSISAVRYKYIKERKSPKQVSYILTKEVLERLVDDLAFVCDFRRCDYDILNV